MIGLALVIAVAIAAALKTPRGPIYWVCWVSAIAYFFFIGPALFGAQRQTLIAAFAIHGGTIGLLLLAIRDGRGTLRSPADVNESR